MGKMFCHFFVEIVSEKSLFYQKTTFFIAFVLWPDTEKGFVWKMWEQSFSEVIPHHLTVTSLQRLQRSQKWAHPRLSSEPSQCAPILILTTKIPHLRPINESCGRNPQARREQPVNTQQKYNLTQLNLQNPCHAPCQSGLLKQQWK